jgi:hypothetical protein
MFRDELKVGWDVPIASTILLLLVVLDGPLTSLLSERLTAVGIGSLVWMYGLGQLLARLWVLGRLWALARANDGPGSLIAWSTAASVAVWIFSGVWMFALKTDGLRLAADLAALVLALASLLALAVAFLRWPTFPDWLGWLVGAYAVVRAAHGLASSFGLAVGMSTWLGEAALVAYLAGLTWVLIQKAAVSHGMGTGLLRHLVFVLGWAGVTASSGLVALGIATWPPGGLAFALPYFFLLTGGVLAVLGVMLLVASRVVHERGAKPKSS